METLETRIKQALKEIEAERNKCYEDEYTHAIGWGLQSALEIIRRAVEPQESEDT